jgi:hypothetical protein
MQVKTQEKPSEKAQTFRMPIGVYELLRKVAFDKRMPMQEIFRQGVDLWLKRNGLPSWDAAEKKSEKR